MWTMDAQNLTAFLVGAMSGRQESGLLQYGVFVRRTSDTLVALFVDFHRSGSENLRLARFLSKPSPVDQNL